jgi:metal-sulfur cluster biosynthetic enzyme
MDLSELINPNPEIFEVQTVIRRSDVAHDDDEVYDEFDSLEVFDLIRNIMDPEHPHTLEQLKVAQHDLVTVDNKRNRVLIRFTPTITHCSMATLIGLCIRVKLLRSLPKRFKVDIYITPGAHQSEVAVNRQLNDKERVAAALENNKLLSVVDKCIAQS